MPRIFVGYRQEKKKGVPKRLVSGSHTTIKNEMKQYPDTAWTVALYDFKPNVENICAIIKDLASFEATETFEYEVNSSGRLKTK